MTATETRPSPGHAEPTPPPVPPTPPARGLPQLTKGFGIVLGSTTVLSGILFYFGWSRAYYFYDYFRVDSSLLDLTTRDYLQLSVDGLFVPVTVIAAVALAVLWAWSWWSAWTARHRRSVVVTHAASIAGALLLLNGLSAIMVRTPLNRHLAVAPLCLAAGAALLVFAVRWNRSAVPVGVAVAEWGVIFVLVGLSLFWAANDYSAAVGRSRAQELTAQLPTFPDATIYSEKSLSLRHPGIRETRCADPQATYAFRYDGLKLVLQSGNQYLFLPASWSPDGGVAIVLPRTETTRLEFAPAGMVEPTTATC